MIRNFLTLLIILTLIGCKNDKQTPQEPISQDHSHELVALMQGSFDSEIQSQVDSTYFNISLHMYPIWKDKGNFLYVEQALSSKQEQPYRQRIYEITRLNDSMYNSAAYTIENDSLWIGKWKTPEAFQELTLDQISKKEGCEVLLKRLDADYFKGETGEKTCESTLYGAAYATSEVEIMEDKIISWDRGFDAKGEHVWGAEKGGYIFNKLD
ncbi:chromophore lyase CpcT/CpeT [Psychroserpens sp. SPM9]|uniref:chromophore lyase CpcT/CpeT n=1 Tax=Psychroserpens sp. SPM9 TaxID=2975598 RepID=UPI0021A2F120|nr:chromophore lyase CpcT/CpeT [Psychroserpens sp. SPM9]MDG5492423.1 chromophore lyase CpcT/CpeT [Psychroserpens sp. SPM9]